MLELARPVIHHRSAEAKEVIVEVAAGLQEGLSDSERRSDSDVLRYRSHGGGRSQLGPPAAKRWCSMPGTSPHVGATSAKAFGINAVMLDTEWGQPVNPEQVAESTRAAPGRRLRDGHPQ